MNDRALAFEIDGTDEWLNAECVSLAERIDRVLDEQEAKRPEQQEGGLFVDTGNLRLWGLKTNNRCIRFVPALAEALGAVQERGWIDQAEYERLYHDEAANPDGWRRVARQLDEFASRVAPSRTGAS